MTATSENAVNGEAPRHHRHHGAAALPPVVTVGPPVEQGAPHQRSAKVGGPGGRCAAGPGSKVKLQAGQRDLRRGRGGRPEQPRCGR